MSMMYNPNDPNAPRPGTPGGPPAPMQPPPQGAPAPGNAPGGANAQQGFLGGLKQAAMGAPGGIQQALLGQATPQMQPDGTPSQGGGPGSVMGAIAGQNQGGLLNNLSQGLQNNAALAPAFKFGKQLASYF